MTIFAPPECYLDPHGFYAERRQTSPVRYDPEQEAWAVYRYADVKAVLFDFATFSSELPRFQNEDTFRETLLNVDPPRHRHLRGVISKAFTPQAIAQMAPRIEAIAQQLLDDMGDDGHYDLVSSFAHPLPVIVISEMLGVSPDDRPQYRRWADELLSGDTSNPLSDDIRRQRARIVQQEMDAYFRAIIAERQKRPGEDLITQLLVNEVDGERLSEEAVLSFCALLLLAGHITTVNLITNGMLCLLENPDELDWLRAHPDAMPQAIEEMLRYRSPVQWLARTATQDLVLGGCQVRKGQLVIPFVGSANRDEGVFADGDRFSPWRHPNPHLSFGHGIHYCLGAPLARLEGAIAMRMLLERYPELRLDLAPGEELQPASNTLLHGVARLPMRMSTLIAS